MEDSEQETGSDPQQDGHLEKEITEKDISVIVSSGGQCCPGLLFISQVGGIRWYTITKNKMHPQARSQVAAGRNIRSEDRTKQEKED